MGYRKEKYIYTIQDAPKFHLNDKKKLYLYNFFYPLFRYFPVLFFCCCCISIHSSKIARLNYSYFETYHSFVVTCFGVVNVCWFRVVALDDSRWEVKVVLWAACNKHSLNGIFFKSERPLSTYPPFSIRKNLFVRSDAAVADVEYVGLLLTSYTV